MDQGKVTQKRDQRCSMTETSGNVVSLAAFKRQTEGGGDEQCYDEYLAQNRRQCLTILDDLRRRVEAGDNICGLLCLAFTEPDADGMGYRLYFNDAVMDYHLLTMGGIESAKGKLTAALDDDEDIEQLPPTPDS